MPAKSVKLYAPKIMKNQDPSFNPDALRSLTEKIETNFKNQGKGPISKEGPARPKSKASKFQKTKEHVARAPVLASNGNAAIGKQKPTEALKTSQGKKRLRDGRVKEGSYGTKGVDVNTIKLGTKNWRMGSDSDTNIDEDFRALGGTEDDFDLIVDVMSESEIEGEEVVLTKNLGKEIFQLVRQLGVDRMGKKEMMKGFESEETDEVEDSQEPEETQNPDMITSNKVTIGVKRALQTATSVGKGQRSLVSNQPCPFQVFFIYLLTLALYSCFNLSRIGMPSCYLRCLYRPKRPQSCPLTYWTAYTITLKHSWRTRIGSTPNQVDPHPLHISSIPPSCRQVRSRTRSRL